MIALAIDLALALAIDLALAVGILFNAAVITCIAVR